MSPAAECSPDVEYDQGAKRAQWFAVRTRSSSEQMVADGLKAREIEHYLPQCSTTRWNERGISRTAIVPMFTGYVFCRVSESFVPVLETPGVVQVIGRGANPEAVPDVEVEAIRAIVLNGRAGLVLPYLVVGQRVKILGLNFEGIVTTFNGREVVGVNVNILGRSVVMDVQAEQLQIIRKQSVC